MVGESARWAMGVAATPVAGLLRAIRRVAFGGACVVEVAVSPSEDLLQREQFLHRLRRLAHDRRVRGVLVRFDGLPGGFAACRDLRQVLLHLRRSGKRVWVFLEQAGNAAYWIASAADRILVVPTGEIGLTGVAVEVTFGGGLLEKLGITPDFVAAGAYKSFGERYARRFASPANFEATSALVADLEAMVLGDVAEGRGLLPADVVKILEEAPLSAARAHQLGLVDSEVYADELEAVLERDLGAGVRRVKSEFWFRLDAALEWWERRGEDPSTVAIVHLEGPIVVDDKGANVAIRARHVAPLVDGLRKDARVKAVVLHVNSPGGSALASDLLWREVDRLQKEKPVVACFADVAASGGFYLAAPAHEIIVRPTTLTGSIGVFGGKLVIADGLARWGVFAQSFGTSPNAHVFSPMRPFDAGQRERFKASLQRFYDGFVDRVAAGRKKPVASVEPLCRGRVWTGRAALDNGLVDIGGGLEDAVERARSLAKLEPDFFCRRHISGQPKSSWAARAFRNAIRSARPATTADAASEALQLLGLYPTAELLHVLAHPEEPLALCTERVEPR